MYPPPHTPRIAEEQEDICRLSCVKSPKSVAFPVELIVTKSITFELEGNPPPNKPRVELEQLARLFLAPVKSPKSDAFPNVEIVIYSIEFVVPGLMPPPIIPRVDEDQDV